MTQPNPLVHGAFAAGTAAQAVYTGGDLGIDWKADETIVTKGDLASRDVLVPMWRTHLFGTAYLGEEHQEGPRDAKIFITADEVDGTHAFADGENTCSIVLGEATFEDTQHRFRRAVIHNFRGAGCFYAGENQCWLYRTANAVPERVSISKGGQGRKPVVAICTWTTARHNLVQAGHALEGEGFEVIMTQGLAAMAGEMLLGNVDAIFFPGEDSRFGRCSWHESGPMEHMISVGGGVSSDLLGRPLVFDQITRPNGYPDFKLRLGYAAFRDATLKNLVLQIVRPFLDP